MKQSFYQELRNLNVVIISHVFATGPALDLEEYLKDKTSLLLFVGLPFSYRKDIRPFYRKYSKGTLVREYYGPGVKLPEILIYLKDTFYTFWWVLQHSSKVNYYIGSDNFSAFLGLALKKFGKVNNVILYTIDYMPTRFKNPVLNWLYHFFDRACLKHCKLIWNVSPVMAEARDKYTGIRQRDCVPQIVVPLGLWYKRIPKLEQKERERYQLVFMGHLIRKQGLDIVIRGMIKILKKFKRTKLLIMGTGDYEGHLKELVKKFKLTKNVEFTGYIEKHEDIERELARSTIAIATYQPDPKSFTNWSDPGKLKNYTGSGLPVILTLVPHVARELEEKKCGIIIDYNPDSFAKAVISLLGDRRLLNEYSNNAVKWARKFDWDIVFNKALRQTLQ